MKTEKKNFDCRIKCRSHILDIIYFLTLSFAEFFIIQLSCHIKEYRLSFSIVVLNASFLIVLNVILVLVFANMKIIAFISYSCVTTISLINYYVVTLHGSPLNIDEIKNAFTALNVLSGYPIKIDHIPALIVSLFCLFCIGFVILNKKIKIKSRHLTLTRVLLLSASFFFILISYFFPSHKIRPQYVINWSWKYSYGTYGYITCFFEDIYSRRKVINEPAEYDVAELHNLVSTLKNASRENKKNILLEEYPDIILILNETFYDLRIACDIETDKDPLSAIHAKNDIYHGYVVVPMIGGGTNQSEYELLTSNSLSLMRSNITPFNVLDLKDANSIVSYLEKLGYTTIGAHSEPSLNYNRKNAYSNLGFDKVYFDNDFADVDYYGKRYFESDISLYKNLTNWYNEVKEEGPIFAYLLTIQNHGEYNSNDSSLDNIHVLNGYLQNEATNEFLTCINQSDGAFCDMINYFNESDRQVIIAMVGDHCPAFAKELLDSEHDEALNILLRETPAYIWANYDLGIENHDIGEMSLINFVPTLLDMAGVPGNTYYDYILEMKKSIPILTVEGDAYADAYHKLSNDNDLLKNYQYLEYLNLKEPDWER